ncbi:polysaccharide deacetylase family protein [Nodosilinea sp. LEGE 07088]|uniref:polysaccharide deacetylase family protein n=1 Tax=Nodosilinea sp. LEGE 07088 TaxID=2777968 RepID=UPI001881B3EE|nr:polysaccharide deacetylase family protein [Nodosilinea sp. LEGE 07088]MBE9135988.1 polysaccharide deacetylase family protein [Nodosilinea sp. LEGE 07088]
MGKVFKQESGFKGSKVRALATLGSGAFLLGAAVPLAGGLATGAISVNSSGVAVSPPSQPPQAFDAELFALVNAPGIDAFPTAVSSERLCRPPVDLAQADPLRDTELFAGTGLETVTSRLSGDAIAALGAEPWPGIHRQATEARVPVLMYHDVLEPPEVFFDLTPEDFENHLKTILDNGLTPISPDQLIQHLRTGKSLPAKPVLLTFDDGYVGHYEHVLPLLQKYQVPATFFVFPGKVDGDVAGRSTLTWEQLKTMAAEPLVTIAAHSVTHPPDLRELSDEDLVYEVVESKRRLESELGIPIRYFSYPTGHYDERVAQAVADAGYMAAFTMRQQNEQFAGASESLLAIERFGQSSLESLVDVAWGGPTAPTPAPGADSAFNFSTPVDRQKLDVEDQSFTLISGGHPVTIHANSRYQLPEILAGTNIAGAVDGGFFSLKYLDSNVMIGPVLSQSTRQFIPGYTGEIAKLNSRPLVLMAPNEVRFVPFDADRHNTLAGLTRELPDVTDAFVAAGWLVKDGAPQPASSFGTLFDFDAQRHRAFWGINTAGQPVVGVTHTMVDSVQLGEMLHQAGLRDAVMLDSGASTSLVYQGDSLVGYTPRPIPHLVGLIPPEAHNGDPCPLVLDADNPTTAKSLALTD